MTPLFDTPHPLRQALLCTQEGIHPLKTSLLRTPLSLEQH